MLEIICVLLFLFLMFFILQVAKSKKELENAQSNTEHWKREYRNIYEMNLELYDKIKQFEKELLECCQARNALLKQLEE